jgi:hypothetical protein
MRALGRFKGWAVAVAVIVMAAGAFAQDRPKIAVYVTGDVPNNEKEALGTRILTSLVNSGRYIAIERSNAFLAEIDKEHIKQRSGAIDDSQISKLGRQFGVKFVCIAAITPAFGDYQVSARIVDVETAVVVFIGESSGKLASMADLSRVSDQVVQNMFSRQATTTPEPTPTPVYAGQPDNQQEQASVVIMTVPSFADIYIDDDTSYTGERFIGTANSGVLQMPAGTYDVRFVKDEWTKIMTMTFSPGENEPQYVRLATYTKNFSSVQRGSAAALNVFLPGVGSLAFMQDWQGAITQWVLVGGGLTLMNKYDDLNHPLFLIGLGTFLSYIPYNIFRTFISCNKKIPKNTAYLENTGLNIAVLPDKDSNIKGYLLYSMEF